jgi:hypothetical protein
MYIIRGPAAAAAPPQVTEVQVSRCQIEEMQQKWQLK